MTISSGLLRGWVLSLLVAPLFAAQPFEGNASLDKELTFHASAGSPESRSKPRDRSSKRRKTPKRNLLAPHERPERPRLA